MSASINNKPSKHAAGQRSILPIEIVRDALSVLQASTYSQLRNIDCDFREGVLTLRGIVSSFFLKQLAQVTVADIRGVEVISNRLEVR